MHINSDGLRLHNRQKKDEKYKFSYTKVRENVWEQSH